MANTCMRSTAALLLASWAWTGWCSEVSSLPGQVQSLLLEQAREAYPNAEITAEIAPLDPRLSLSECSKLTLTPRSEQTYGRIPVAVQCHAPYAWSVFLTGQVAVVVPVVVASDALVRGTTLSSADLALAPRNLATLRNQYLTDIESAAGLETRSPLRAEQVIYATQLKRPLAVRRGERVTILANRGAVRINAQGEALQNGMAGSQIRVKNLQSERIVHAWVRGQGLVATTPGP